MYKALASIDSLVRLPSGRIATVLKHLAGNALLLEYTDGGGKVEIDAKHLRPASEPLEAALRGNR